MGTAAKSRSGSAPAPNTDVPGAAAPAADAAVASRTELVKGFRLLRMPMAGGSLVARGLLVKRHQAQTQEEQESAERTLFVTHLDNFVSEAQLQRSMASAFGSVEKVELKSVEKTAPRWEQRLDHVRLHVNFARVIFRESSSVERALAAASTGRLCPAAVLPPPASLGREKSVYRDPVELRKEVDEWMANHDEREEAKRLAARENAVDEDGFTKVVSGITRTEDGLTIHAAKRPTLKTGAFAEPLKGTQEASDNTGEKKKKNKEMPDFYRFQLREKKREEIIDHRKRQKEDAEKVERMRTAKKFKAAAV